MESITLNGISTWRTDVSLCFGNRLFVLFNDVSLCCFLIFNGISWHQFVFLKITLEVFRIKGKQIAFCTTIPDIWLFFLLSDSCIFHNILNPQHINKS